MKRLVLLFFISALSGCTPVIKLLTGFRDPQIKSIPALNGYANKFGIDSSIVVFVDDTSTMYRLYNMFGGGMDMLIFDGNKKIFPYKDYRVSCNAPIENVIKNICTIQYQPGLARGNENYEFIMDHIADQNHALAGFDIKNYDFLILLNYVSYAGRVNKTHLPGYVTAINVPKNCRVKYLFIDLDYHDGMKIKKEDLPKIRLTADNNR